MSLWAVGGLVVYGSLGVIYTVAVLATLFGTWRGQRQGRQR